MNRETKGAWLRFAEAQLLLPWIDRFAWWQTSSVYFFFPRTPSGTVTTRPAFRMDLRGVPSDKQRYYRTADA